MNTTLPAHAIEQHDVDGRVAHRVVADPRDKLLRDIRASLTAYLLYAASVGGKPCIDATGLVARIDALDPPEATRP